MRACVLHATTVVRVASSAEDRYLLGPAAALGRMSPWHIKLQCLDLVAAFLLGVSSAMCTRQPPTASILAHFRLPARSSVHAWLLRLRTGSDFAPARLPPPDPVLHVSAPVRNVAVADARLGLAWCPIYLFVFIYFFTQSGRKAVRLCAAAPPGHPPDPAYAIRYVSYRKL